MSASIICPNCNFQFEPTEALAQTIREDMRKEFNTKWLKEKSEYENNVRKREHEILQQQEVKEANLRQKELQLLQQEEKVKAQQLAQETEVQRQLEQHKKVLEAQLSKQLRDNMQGEYEQQIKLLQETNKNNESRLSVARDKEMEFLKKMQELQAKEQEIELQIQRKVLEERAKLGEIIKKEEEERAKIRDTEHLLKMKEKEKQLEDQQKLIAEMQRKMEQGSMQLQGEVQELELEQMLRHAFPFDILNEVGKGVRGADCVLTVRNSFGQQCGKIIFESKRTKDFSDEWIEKLKADSRTLNADVAIIVTQAMPKGMDCFGERNGVWVCGFDEVKALTFVLRDLVIKVFGAGKSQENKGDKMTLLYSYLVSREFAEQWGAIREGFMSMKMSIQTERNQMEKLWKAREKQLEKVLLNAAHIRGSIEGISGMDVDLKLLPEGDDEITLIS